MGKIQKLDDILSNKIAAGEVVERPASVVKELVENAIDANSTVVEIEIEEGGLSQICILDNGDGIAAEDVLVAFERHATSKIKDENDLFRIRTLGFRGEALPSIASVSELELNTSTGDAPGTHLVLKGGHVITHEPGPSRKGTEIKIKHLFFNTPARLKYMKTVNTEIGNISDIVNRIALSHPDVSIKLTHNGRKLLHTNGNGDVRQVLAAIYGMAVAKKLKKVSAESLDFTMEGYVALPEVNRASRNYLTVIVNGRYVKNYPLHRAVQQGFHTLLPIGRYPIGLLSIVMDPMLVDVNVHPSKLEVRFSKEAELNALIEECIKDALRQERLIPEMAPVRPKKKVETVQETFMFEHQLKDVPLSKTSISPKIEEKQEAITYVPVEKVKQEVVHEQSSTHGIEYDLVPPPITEYELPVYEEELPLAPVFVEEEVEEEIQWEEEKCEEDTEKIPPLYPIGQMHGTYILAQNENGLYLIDQHAAQERVKYEYFREKVGQVANEVQELLVPHHIELSLNEYLLIQENIEELEKVGIFLEEFGHQSYIVRSHPQWFLKGQEIEIIDDIIQQVLKAKKVDIKKLREEAAIMMSCKASIKANHHLRNDEIFALLESLRQSESPFTCPHGRPIMIHYSTYELEKMFKRVM
ncbi:DNA mismatch repair endonuclease MutL [Priestia taiwanensis]|uniref:DNA mismatch repair protein MutL n=1 Tax=Priestia taiwanensis TaxID=1347902 RepID=A0A917ARJ3_9BACI|nr:DNA mismatch repair endonuclease MutL [Priestia taiwanensis]MBM7362759.1 DNA mismatch repair protein MutL [Priestia taiwanensis]GGE64844.1 DNA mismatch repair protein MutL [Priestia taiwanensis]